MATNSTPTKRTSAKTSRASATAPNSVPAVPTDAAATVEDAAATVSPQAVASNGHCIEDQRLQPLLESLRAARQGEFSNRLPALPAGVLSEIHAAFNDMIALNEAMADEMVRIARIVGREGRMTERATLPGAVGSWANSKDSLNSLIEDLARPTTEVARVITAVAEGDLSQKMALEIQGTPIKGEFLRIGTTVNTMVDQLSAFSSEVTRVAREVGTEGMLGGQAEVPGVSGTWKDLTDNVNGLASNLTAQVRNIALVTTAVANGDLSQKITVDARGEILELKSTINTMVDQLNSFAAEVTRVAKEVGTEGKLGGQAEVGDVSGTWKDLTDNVNFMASNLTMQLRDVSKVATAIADGDLTQKITVEVRGEIWQIKNVINQMVDSLSTFAGEVTRVAKEVGTEGKLGGQAEVRGVSGTWKDLTDNVNSLASNLTNQVRNIASVTTAVANGDLSKKITVDVKGEVLELKDTINTMVDQLNAFSSEVTRVAREVGTEGKLGGQADVPGSSGTWKDLTDNVNFMASNLTGQVRNIALVTTAVANGDLSKKITVDARGEILELKSTINTMVDQLNSFASEVTRVAKEVGTEGRLGGQAEVRDVSGTWKDLTDNVNIMATNLTMQLRDVSKVATAIADGDLTQKITVEVRGEIRQIKTVINQMVDSLSTFAGEVTRVSKEVGTEGMLGGQAKVPNAAGTWKDLTDNVNFMASNLTTQVRGIAKVVTAVANGDLTQKLAVEAKGEVAALAETINSMTGTLSTFAEQVTSVAREVGTEGKLGGQAKVPGVAGTWKDLTDNVNGMANSLTVQVRAISDVATSVTEGDLTRTIDVEAQGEVDSLKNNLNQMIGNLRDTTNKNQEQDFLKTNLARFSRMMQGQKSLESVSRLIMSEVTPLVGGHQAVFYVSALEAGAREPVLKLLSSYAFQERKSVANRFALGEGLVGQCALEKKSILLTQVPGDYIQISSGLGQAPPLNVIVMPVLFEGEIMAVIEIASFAPFSEIHRTFLAQLTESVGVVLNMIQANTRTEELLEQSQNLTQELQSQSQELQSQQGQLKSTNIELEAQKRELEEKATLLVVQNTRVEQKNLEVETARAALEEKAEQLALSSKYKSEFLANMSHELRTPLNSMLILAKLLSENSNENLTPKQVEFAGTIHQSGNDLLNLINEILDLSKVEAGRMEVLVSDVPLDELRDTVERTFGQTAAQKNLSFAVSVLPNAPAQILTDGARLQQVLKNLISNAIKFTEKGGVELTIAMQGEEIAFAVSDSGIGIAPDKQKVIFEAFQQAEGGTSRKYGGTGLGLSISREIARLLGGRIELESTPDQGSTFTLILPLEYDGEPLADANAFGELDEAFGGLGGTGDSGGGDLLDEVMSRAQGQVERAGAGEASPSQVEALTSQALAAHLAGRGQDGGEAVEDDRDNLDSGDPILLIIEDDADFGRILIETARSQGFKTLVAHRGDVGLAMARQYKPAAITLDLKLPMLNGWTVLDHLKRDVTTRHIPVQVISVLDRERGSIIGAISYLEKPVSREALEGAMAHIKSFLEREVRALLLVEDDEGQRQGLTELLNAMKVEVTWAGDGEQAQQKLEDGTFDCMVLDLGLPGMSGFELLRRTKQQAKHQDLPVVIYTSRDLSRQEEMQIKRYAAAIVTKGGDSAERLVEETARFLHRVLEHPSAPLAASKLSAAAEKEIAKAPSPQQILAQPAAAAPKAKATPAPKTPAPKTAASKASATQTPAAKPAAEADKVPRRAAKSAAKAPTASTSNGAKAGTRAGELKGKAVLIVDDDMRNIFALTSALENHDIVVSFAESGDDALETLKTNASIELVLMDVMMPEMDGYETTRAIRALPNFGELPIIALTAKAMEGDREKCLEAGASDYITKPVDIPVLLDMMAEALAK